MYTHTGRGILRALTTALRPNYNGNASWLWRRGGLIKYSPVHEGGGEFARVIAKVRHH